MVKSKISIEIKIIILYLICNFLIINDAIFWDDWVWYDNKEQLSQGIKELGFGPIGLFQQFLYNNPMGIMFSKSIVLLLGLCTGLLFKKILDEFSIFGSEEKLFLTAFFVLAPINITKSSLCVSNNMCAIFLFYLGAYFWIYSANTENRNRNLFKSLGAGLLFISFFTNSFLTFVPVLCAAYWFKVKIEKTKSLINSLKIDILILISLPILFWIVKKIFFSPSGFYTSYNQINILNVSYILKGLVKSVYYAYFGPVELFLVISGNLVTLSLGILVGVTLNKLVNEKSIDLIIKKRSLIFVIMGGGAIAIAAFPYLTVGKIPLFTFHESRHQLLMQFGYSFTLFYIIDYLFNRYRRIKTLLQWGVVVVLIIFNLKSYIGVHTMKHSVDAVRQEFSENSIYKENRVFLFSYENQNEIPGYSSFVVFYEYSGLLYDVFRDQSRLPMMNKDDYRFIGSDDFFKKRYKLSGITESEKIVKVTIKNEARASDWDKVSTIILSYIDKEAYLGKIKGLLRFNYEIDQTINL